MFIIQILYKLPREKCTYKLILRTVEQSGHSGTALHWIIVHLNLVRLVNLRHLHSLMSKCPPLPWQLKLQTINIQLSEYIRNTFLTSLFSLFSFHRRHFFFLAVPNILLYLPGQSQ